VLCGSTCRPCPVVSFQSRLFPGYHAQGYHARTHTSCPPSHRARLSHLQAITLSQRVHTTSVISSELSRSRTSQMRAITPAGKLLYFIVAGELTARFLVTKLTGTDRWSNVWNTSHPRSWSISPVFLRAAGPSHSLTRCILHFCHCPPRTLSFLPIPPNTQKHPNIQHLCHRLNTYTSIIPA
ncbi:unnamed protein product, partial [Ectocarpus sp. 6 AP-2014]